jgi:hypothetical protein
MKVFTSKDKYPFDFYCNATGDLFIPDTDPNKVSRDLTDMSELPYPLQALYERFWSEQYGWLTYMVKADTGYGMMMEQEYSADAGEDYGVQMDALYEQIATKAKRIEKSLFIVCPKAEVVIGRETGLDGCHELCVFVPADAKEHEIKAMIYILTSADKGRDLPCEKGQLYSQQYSEFLAANENFSVCRGISPYYANQPITVIEFTDDSESAEFTVLVAQKAMEEDGIFDVEKVEARIKQVMRNIKESAEEAGRKVDLDTLIVRACNIIFPCAWDFPRPVFTINMDVLDEEGE